MIFQTCKENVRNTHYYQWHQMAILLLPASIWEDYISFISQECPYLFIMLPSIIYIPVIDDEYRESRTYIGEVSEAESRYVCH